MISPLNRWFYFVESTHSVSGCALVSIILVFSDSPMTNRIIKLKKHRNFYKCNKLITKSEKLLLKMIEILIADC